MFDPVGGAASKGLMCNLLICLLHCVMVDRLVCVLFKLLHLDTDSGFEYWPGTTVWPCFLYHLSQF